MLLNILTIASVLDTYSQKIKEVQKMVDEFRKSFVKLTEKLENEHVKERCKLVAMKKLYNKMIKVSGKQFVEMQLCISKEQSWRTTRRESYFLDGETQSDELVNEFDSILY